MLDRTKKILLLVGFILLVILIGFLIYWIFFRPMITPPVVITPTVPVNVPPTGLPTVPPALNIPTYLPTVTLPPGITPEIPSAAVPTPISIGPTISYTAEGGLTAFQTVVDTAAGNPTVAANGSDVIFYDVTSGFYYNLTPDGQKQLFSDLPFKNVSNTIWAPNKQKAILEYPDGSKMIYDFSQKKSVPLPSHWKDFSFAPDSKQIAFKDMRLDPENRYIAVADTNGGSYRQIEKLGKQDEYVYINWSPNNKVVALFREPLDGDRSTVYPIGFNGENYNSLIVEGRDLRFNWAPSGKKMIYSVFNSASNYNPALWVVNTDGELMGTGRTAIGLQTWADKCAFASENIVYCAVPRTLEKGSGFRPDMANGVPDDIYKIDVVKGTKELVAQPLYPTTIMSIFASEDGSSLYWLEQFTNNVKKMGI